MSKRPGPGERIDKLTRHDRPIRFEGDILARAFAPRQHELTAPAVTIDSAPYVCLIVNVEWISHVLGVLETLNQPDAWQGDETEKDRAQNEIQRLLEMLMTGDACMVDPCCPETNELLLQLVTLNQTIVNNQIIMIDNDTTIINNNYDAILNQYQDTYNQYVTNNQQTNILNQIMYDGDPRSIATNVEADGTSNDGALCAAVTTYIENIVAVYTANVNLAARLAGLISSAVAAVIIGATLGTAAPFLAAWGLIVGGGLIGVPLAIWNAIASDPNAKRKVICCMFEHLQGQSLTQENFKSAVQDCDFDPTTYEGRMAGLIYNESQSEANYLAFLRMVGQSSGGSAASCQCGCETAFIAPYSGPLGRQYPASTVEYAGELVYTDMPGSPTFKTWIVRPGGQPAFSEDPLSQWGIRFQIIGQTGDCVFDAFDQSDNWRKDSGYIDDTDQSVHEFIGAMGGGLAGCNTIYWQGYYNSYNAPPTPGYDYRVVVRLRSDLTECPEE